MGTPAGGDGAHLKALLDAGKHHEAGRLLEQLLEGDPENLEAVYFLVRLMVDSGKPQFGFLLADYLTLKWPHSSLGWFVKGVCQTHLRRPEEAVRCLHNAIAIKPTQMAYGVLACAEVMRHEFDLAKQAADKSLSYGEHYMPRVALAFYHLQRREWEEGWKNYTAQMGRDKDRAIMDFGLPEWTGSGSALIYGEQGLGDQLCYVSSIDERCRELVCHPKLANLLRRSLDIDVHGDQFVKTIEWEPRAEYQCSMATAMQWQDVKRRGRWLTPHPDKKIQWQSLLEAKAMVRSRPWIGIAWTGGRTAREQEARNVMPEQLRPLLDLEYNFVSLEYRSHGNIPGVFQFPWATQTDDLDDCAALVDSLSAVVTVPTTTYHIAGSLGIPCHVIVHDKPHFHEGIDGDCPWWESVKFHRGDRVTIIRNIAEQLARL